MTRRRDEGGSALVELVLLTPLVMMVMMLVIGFGRIASSRGEVDGAARDAARAASISRSADGAQAAAQDQAASTLGSRSVTCSTLDVAVDASSFGPGGHVSVDVSCTVSLGDLFLVAWPGTTTMRAHAVAVVDTFRAVS